MPKKQNASVNQFIAAVTEKVSALMTEDYLMARAKRGNRSDFRKILAKVPDMEPDEQDRF